MSATQHITIKHHYETIGGSLTFLTIDFKIDFLFLFRVKLAIDLQNNKSVAIKIMRIK
jgi:hypothetical protein